MKQILYFFVLFLSVPCFAQEVQTVENPPEGEYFVYNGKIYTLSPNRVHDYYMYSFELPTYEQAVAFVSAWESWLEYYNTLGLESPYTPASLVGTPLRSNYTQWYPNPFPSLVILPRRSGASDVVRWVVVFAFEPFSPFSGSSSGLFLGAMFGLNTNWCVGGDAFRYYVLRSGLLFSETSASNGARLMCGSDVIYSPEPEPEPEPDPTPDVPADGGPYVITFIDGVQYYVLPESSYPTDDYSVIVNGPSLWASSLASAQTCADNFADFLESYSWPFWGVPDIMPYSEPKIYKCQTFFNGEAAGTFYRIVFQDYTNSAALAYDGHYSQCLNDYSQGAGGTGGYNTMSIVKPCATYTDTVNVSSELAGVTLASTSNSDTGQLTQITDDVAVTQYTAAKVNAEEGDYTGTSTVSSTASASEDGTTVNITNNTTVETNLELGDAPDADSYSNSEDGGEKEVQESGSLLTQQETAYTYIDDSSTEKKIDWEKFWGDFKEKIGEMIGYDKIEAFFGQEIDSQPLTDWSVNVMGASFVIPWSILLSSQPIAIARSALSAFCMLGTFFACFRMLA